MSLAGYLGEGAASAESIHEAMIPQDGRLAVGQKPPSSPSCGARAVPVLLDGVHGENDSPVSMSNHGLKIDRNIGRASAVAQLVDFFCSEYRDARNERHVGEAVLARLQGVVVVGAVCQNACLAKAGRESAGHGASLKVNK